MTEKIKKIKAPRGTRDILPKEIANWREIEKAARLCFVIFNYREIRTPIFEDTRLFVRGIGESSDIVEKEMYTLLPRGKEEDSLTLRPEATAGVVRAYVEKNLSSEGGLQKLYYIGPMFRYERPQAGRARQFHQIGIEAIGSDDPLLDVETIILAREIFIRLGLKNFELKLNSIGCSKCRPEYRKEIIRHLEDQKEKLCDNCKRRISRNVLRVLDCKKKPCQEVVKKLPPIEDYLDEKCREHFRVIRQVLSNLGVEYQIESRLVRGLDYYTRTVYEFVHSGLGARSAICGGGRYDNLINEVGGEMTGAVGFAFGMEATLKAMESEGLFDKKTVQGGTLVQVLIVEDALKVEGFGILSDLRSMGLAADMGYGGKSLKAQMRQANRSGASFAVIVGPQEMEEGVVVIRNLLKGDEEKVPRTQIKKYDFDSQTE